MNIQPLRSLLIPDKGNPNNKNTFYVSHPYVYHGDTGVRMMGLDATLGTEAKAIIDIYYDNHFASVYCDNNTACLLQGGIPGATLKIIKNGKQIILTFIPSSNEGKPVTAISVGGHAVQPASENIAEKEEMLSLTSNENTPTVYSGTEIPDNSLGQPGDLYIKISAPSTETEG